MSLDPVECHLMIFFRLQKALPEIYILHLFVFSALPPLLDPALDPVLVEGVDHILGIRIDLHLTGAVQGFQSHDHRHHLHPVIGGLHISLGQLLRVQLSFRIHIFQYRAIAAGPLRVSPGRTVRI